MAWQDDLANGDTGPIGRVRTRHQDPPTVHGELPVTAMAPGGNGQAPRGQAGTRVSRPVVLKALGLVLVAVVAGVSYWLVNRESPSAPQAAGQAGSPTSAQQSVAGSDFRRVAGPVRGADCVEQSYGDIQDYLKEHSCAGLRRVLYSTGTGDKRVLSSVSTVTMTSPADARRLQTLTDRDATGNITDLVTSGMRVPGGPDSLKGGGYASSRDGKMVTVVESKFFDGHPGDPYLTKISEHALKLH